MDKNKEIIILKYAILIIKINNKWIIIINDK